MQDHQFLKPLPSKTNKDTSVLGLWLFPIATPLKPITVNERKWANGLTTKRKREYHHSRGYARFALSELFKVDPLEIPLHAQPGKAPKLEKGWGHISLSHCNNALLVGWSPKKLGIDLERTNRSFNAENLVKRFFSQREKDLLKSCTKDNFHQNVLSRWVIKEAAIKWQQGSIYNDLAEWESSRQYNLALHKKLNLTVNTKLIIYSSWLIAIAYDEKFHKNQPILCLS